MRISLNSTPDDSGGGAIWRFKGFLDLDWQRRGAIRPDAEANDPHGWLQGSVPGSVHHDLWQGGLIADPYFGLNSFAAEWVSERAWVYRTTFTVGAEHQGKRSRLVFQGVDYAADFYLNGAHLGHHASQFTPAIFEVADRLRHGEPNTLTVVLHPAPPEQGQHGRTSLVRTHRTRMNYGWDFCPRLPHLGLWQDVYLEITGAARIEDVWVRPRLLDDFTRAEIEVALELSREGESGVADGVQVELTIRGGPDIIARARAEYADRMTLSLALDFPRLWWPNGYGEPVRYQAAVTLTDRDGAELDSRRVAFGIRRIEWAANAVTPGSENADALPYTLVVNGKKVSMQGYNWVPSDVLYGVPRPDKLRRLLNLAARANINILRVCGVGLIESEAFYDLCDRLGILIWQEFILSSSSADRTPSDDPTYLDLLRREAASIIRQKRNHPALALWCGGNELETDQFVPVDADVPALVVLRDAVQQHDPDRLWRHTSASGPMPYCGINTATNRPFLMHDVHGPWHHQGLTAHYTLYNRSRSLLHSEFGAESLANLRTLRLTLLDAELWPIRVESPVWQHRGAANWLRAEVWRAALGEVAFRDLPTLIRATQFLQAEGVRYGIEANRRRLWENSGSLPWKFNEAYPMAVRTSAVDYYAMPKPVYYAAMNAYKPLTVSARFETLGWAGHEMFRADLFAVSTEDQAAEGATLEIRLFGSGGQLVYSADEAVTVPANGAAQIGSLAVPLVEIPTPIFFLDLWLWLPGSVIPAHNRYVFSTEADMAALFAIPDTTLEARYYSTSDFLTLTNTGEHIALFVTLEESADPPTGQAYFGDGGLCLLPGETHTVGVEWDAEMPFTARGVRVTAWNAPPLTV